MFMSRDATDVMLGLGERREVSSRWEQLGVVVPGLVSVRVAPFIESTSRDL